MCWSMIHEGEIGRKEGRGGANGGGGGAGGGCIGTSRESLLEVSVGGYSDLNFIPQG